MMEGKTETALTTINTSKLASGNYIFNINRDGIKDHRIFTISR